MTKKTQATDTGSNFAIGIHPVVSFEGAGREEGRVVWFLAFEKLLLAIYKYIYWTTETTTKVTKHEGSGQALDMALAECGMRRQEVFEAGDRWEDIQYLPQPGLNVADGFVHRPRVVASHLSHAAAGIRHVQRIGHVQVVLKNSNDSSSLSSFF